MKRPTFTIVMSLLVLFTFGQTPESFNYQAVVRDSEGNALTEQSVSLRISILESNPTGNVVYEETHSVTTDSYGRVSIAIGDGNVTSGQFATIEWGVNEYFLKNEIDIEGEGNYTEMGTTQLLSVPYALHAKNVTNAEDADADATNEIQNLQLSGDSLKLEKANSILLPVDDADADPTNEIQQCSDPCSVKPLEC